MRNIEKKIIYMDLHEEIISIELKTIIILNQNYISDEGRDADE